MAIGGIFATKRTDRVLAKPVLVGWQPHCEKRRGKLGHGSGKASSKPERGVSVPVRFRFKAKGAARSNRAVFKPANPCFRGFFLGTLRRVELPFFHP